MDINKLDRLVTLSHKHSKILASNLVALDSCDILISPSTKNSLINQMCDLNSSVSELLIQEIVKSNMGRLPSSDDFMSYTLSTQELDDEYTEEEDEIDDDTGDIVN